MCPSQRQCHRPRSGKAENPAWDGIRTRGWNKKSSIESFTRFTITTTTTTTSTTHYPQPTINDQRRTANNKQQITNNKHHHHHHHHHHHQFTHTTASLTILIIINKCMQDASNRSLQLPFWLHPTLSRSTLHLRYNAPWPRVSDGKKSTTTRQYKQSTLQGDHHLISSIRIYHCHLRIIFNIILQSNQMPSFLIVPVYS